VSSPAGPAAEKSSTGGGRAAGGGGDRLSAAPGAIWVVGEQRQGVLAEVSLELAAEARRLADAHGVAVEALLFGGGDDAAASLAKQGANALRRIEAEGLDFADPAHAAAVLAWLVEEGRPRLLLFGATRAGEEIAARLAARLGVSVLSRCTRITEAADGRFEADRAVYRSRASATVALEAGGPAVATVQPGVFSVSRKESSAGPRIKDIPLPDLAPSPPTTTVEGSWRVSPWEMDLEEAEVIVAGGLGLATPSDFEMLAELAAMLGGAVAASRPVVDAGVVPYDRQVGISGRIVRPRLYIACAISGSVHHLGGMKESGSVIAINRDRHAPMMELADLAVVGDAREVVPALLAALPRECSEGSVGPSTLRKAVREAKAGVLA
jgi:electron transfer flavoprotein alpha subunit